MAVDRRQFFAGLSGFALGVGFGRVSHYLPLKSPEFGPEWAPGEESFVSSTCMLCPAHCGIRGRLMDGLLVRISGNPLHPISSGGLCAKGVAGLQLLYHPARLTGPVERTGPPGSIEFKPVTWEYALGRIGSKLKELADQGDASSVAMIAGHTTGLMGELLQTFTTSYGTPHLIHDDYSDGSSEVLRVSQGIDAPPAFDLAASDFVLSFGAPLAEAWSGLPQASSARYAAGGHPRWVQVDVRHSRTAANADEWIGIRPGTYGVLALGLAYILLKEGIYDAENARANVIGLDDQTGPDGSRIPGFRSVVAQFGRTEEVAQQTGVPPDVIVRLAKNFGSARRPVALWDNVVAWRTGGFADALAIHALNILVGTLDRPGGILVQPRIPVPSLDEMAGRGRPNPPKQTSTRTGASWASLIANGSARAPKALFLYYSNPVASSPAPDDVVTALGRVPLVVSFSPFLDETARHATLVLPDCTYLERWQDAPAPPSVPIPVWGLVQPMVKPLYDTRATGDVLLDLARKIEGDVAQALPFDSFEQVVKKRGESLVGARRGGVFADQLSREEMREIEARGWWIPHGRSESDFWDAILETGGWFDPYYDYDDRSLLSQFPDGKVRIFPPGAKDRTGLTATGQITSPFAPVAGSAESGYPLQLIPFRVMTIASGSTALMPWLLEKLGVLTGDAWRTWVEINPETAIEHGVVNGQRVTVESAVGRFEAQARVFAGAQPGVLNVPYGLHTQVEGWGVGEGANPLRAVGNRLDAQTGMPDWYSTRVRIVKS